MPQDISAILAKQSGGGSGGNNEQNSAHRELDLTDANIVSGAGGTIAPQQDESHYDVRYRDRDDCEGGAGADADDDDGDCGCHDMIRGSRIRFPRDRLYGRDGDLDALRRIYGQVVARQKRGDGEVESRAAPEEKKTGEDDGDEDTDSNSDNAKTKNEQAKTNKASTATKRVVFLSGLSGTGKSALVEELVRQVGGGGVTSSVSSDISNKDSSSSHLPLYGAGKFVQFGTTAPFSALDEVLNQWSADVVGRGGRELRQVRSNLLKAGVGPTDEGGYVLRNMFPCLTPVLLDVEVDTNEQEKGDEQANHAKSKNIDISMDALKVLLQVFVTALCRKQCRPAIMFIDDLQWADEATLEVISSLVTSKSIEHFLFIGAYRSNEVQSEDHPFRKHMVSIREALNAGADNKEAPSCSKDEDVDGDNVVRHMEIFNLSHKDVAKFIADTIDKDPAEVSPLADLVYESTVGNIFFVMQALEELVRRNVLYFDIITYEWQWNLNMTAELESFVGNDVLDMIKCKIEGLEEAQRRALTLAAYTQNVIDAGTLRCLLASDGMPLELDDVIAMLERFVDEGLLLQSEDPSEYGFAHDLINEASRSRVSSGEERTLLLLQIAKVLSDRWSSAEGKDWMLFVAANHFNMVPREYLDSSMELEALAKLNLRASKLSCAKAALARANEYLRAGVAYLPTDKTQRWKNYDLCLDLFDCLLQSEASFGHYKEAEAAIDEVLTNAVGEGDKCKAYLALMKCSAEKGERDYNLGAKKGCYILILPFPPSKKDILRERMLLKVKRRNRPMAALLKMPIVKDDVMRMRIKLYSTTQEFANLSQNHSLVKLIEIRALRDAYAYGCVGPDFAQMLANSAVGLVKDGKFKTAFGYANLATNIMNKSSDAESAWIRLKLKFGVLQLRHPFREDIPDCAELYKRLISGGSVSEGMGCALTCALAYYSAGLPLSSMWATKLLLYERAARDFGKDSFTLLFQVNRQFLLNLQGKSECSPTAFEGEAFNEDDALAKLEGNARTMALRDISTLRIQLAYVFRDDSTMDEMTERLASYPLSDMMVARQHLRLSFLGLAVLTDGPKQKKKEHLALGKNILKCMKTLDHAGSPNAHPVYLCLKAVSKMSMDAFDKAIEACAAAGMMHLEAVMNERCAIFLQGQGDEEKSKVYFTNALTGYNAWGAHAKVSQLKETYDFLRRAKLHRVPTVATSSDGTSVIS